jgi:transposase
MKHTPDEIHAAISGKLDPLECPFLKTMLDWLDQLNAQIEKINNQMMIAAKPDEAQMEIFCSIPGIDVNAGLAILAEIGPAPQKSFANSGRLCSWAGLVPRNDESAGKVKSRRILNGNPYLKSLLVQTSWAAVSHRQNEFSRWFWCRQAILGRKKVIIAVARKMLVLIFTLLKSGEFYNPNNRHRLPLCDNG